MRSGQRIIFRPGTDSARATQRAGSSTKAVSCVANRRRTRRRGAAVVELAVVTPLLLLMMFGIMEFGWLLMMKETMTNACREACRVRVLRGSTDTDARNRFTSAVAGTGLTVSSSQLTIASTTLANGDVIWAVTVSVPRSQVSLFGLTSALQNMMGIFTSGASLGNANISTTCSMRAET